MSYVRLSEGVSGCFTPSARMGPIQSSCLGPHGYGMHMVNVTFTFTSPGTYTSVITRLPLQRAAGALGCM